MNKLSENERRSFRAHLYGMSNSVPKTPERPCAAVPLRVDFNALIERLTHHARLHVELDGSFVHRSDDNDNQIDGMIYDLNDCVQYVELSGICDRPFFRKVVDIICQNQERICFQDLAGGVVLTRESFEKRIWW